MDEPDTDGDTIDLDEMNVERDRVSNPFHSEDKDPEIDPLAHGDEGDPDPHEDGPEELRYDLDRRIESAVNTPEPEEEVNRNVEEEEQLETQTLQVLIQKNINISSEVYLRDDTSGTHTLILL